jgi:endonuclease VIII
MPEGDTVWRACQRLNEVLAGRTLTRCEFRVPTLATTDLTGVGIREVVSRGKHQLFRFANDHTLHTHFRMDGTWRIYPAGRKWSGGPEFQIRAVLATAEHSCVGYRLPVIELIPTADEPEVVGHLGPDLLGPDWDEEEALRRLARESSRPVGVALLDQRNLAGIGNMYMAELCFTMGVNPASAVATVDQLPRLVRRGKQMLEVNKERAIQTTTGDLRERERMWVYRRDNAPCRRCRTPIAVTMLGELGRERAAYWCPSCQPER